MDGICMLCKEPITTPLEIGQIGKHIEMWLPGRLVEQFNQLNSGLTRHVRTFYRVSSSGTLSGRLVCMHCYVKEVYQWLKEVDTKLANQFIMVFSFGYSKESFEKDDMFCPPDESPEEEQGFGLCDECGEYGESLEYMTGEWICKDCSFHG